MKAPPRNDSSLEKGLSAFPPIHAEIGNFLQEFRSASLFESQPPQEFPDSIAGFLESGRSVLRASEYRFAPKACKEVASVLLDLLRKRLPDREDALGRIQGAFAAGEIPPKDFVSLVFRGRSEEILGAAKRLGVDEGLLTFIAVYLARPFRAQAALELTREVDLGKWHRGHCPVCGNWPALAHIQSVEGRRTLWCLLCGTHWPYGRLQCPYCLNEDQEALNLISAEAEPSFRAHTCARCGKYIKEVMSALSAEAFSFDVFYLGTRALDLLAASAGFAPHPLLAAASVDP